MPRIDDQEMQRLLGSALKRLREAGGLSRQELAQGMGDLSLATDISSWESGQSSPLAHQLWRYLDALNLSFTDLDLELDPKARDPGLRELADELDAMGH